ncbi:DSBA-like thioredoxin domain protein [compost metagenome]
MDAHTVEASKGEGIVFNYAAMEKTPNTFLAHRLMKLAEQEGKAIQMANALFSAYFEQGRDIGDASVLTDVAVEVGVQREQAQTYLSGDAGAEEVRADEREAHGKGVRSVPFFDISGDGIISGAQSAEQFKAAVLRATKAMDGCANGACVIA